jgi:hypothetical protein
VGCEVEVKQLIKNMESLYYLIENFKKFPELKKEILFPTVVGTAGKGKTTFARQAYENSKVYSKIVNPDVVEAIRECNKAG